MQRGPSILVHGMNVRVAFYEQRQRLWTLDETGDVQWRLVVTVAHVDHGTRVQQEASTLCVILLDGQMQSRGPSLAKLGAHVCTMV